MRSGSRRDFVTLALLLGVVGGMAGLAFAAVPLYRVFCEVTGYGGYTQRAELAPAPVPGSTIAIRFNADVNARLPWTFQPQQREMTLAIGETGLALYRAQNLSDQTIVGTATFNVTPFKAGQYFSKIECFCFREQALGPGETADLPVSFFVDPAILDDANLADVHAITLSYTFFRAADDNGEPAAPARVSDAAPVGPARTLN
jgi:cytochrome c oxidase assembly protein subunit 11